jgi:hypothetical protein
VLTGHGKRLYHLRLTIIKGIEKMTSFKASLMATVAIALAGAVPAKLFPFLPHNIEQNRIHTGVGVTGWTG